MVRSSEALDLDFEKIKESTLETARSRGEIWLRVRKGLRPDYTTGHTYTEVYFMPKPKITGIHLFSIDDQGEEDRETMVVRNKNLPTEKLETPIREFIGRFYPELKDVKVNFVKNSQGIDTTQSKS